VHKWVLPKIEDLQSYEPSNLTVSEVMQTDLMTVQKDDLVELVAELMDWNKLRYAPVENTKGDLIGLVSVAQLLKHYISRGKSRKAITVSELMIKNVVTINQSANILDAINLMKEHNIGCLPVVEQNELIGLVTETDMIRISGRVLTRVVNNKKKK